MKPESKPSSASPSSVSPSPETRSHALPADDPHGCLSALADGEAASLGDACALWRDDARARQTWHAYHLIGDVLRSEELAHRPARDAAFLAGVRRRLAAEPVVLAPQPLPRRATRQPWLMPAAVAAGFVVVAGVLVVTRVGLPDAAAPVPVLAAASVPGITRVGNAPVVVNGGLAADAAVIRNARLDEYLRAHQTARGGVALVAPGGSLRQVDVVVPGASR